MSGELDLLSRAREIAEQSSYVEVEQPEMPELTGDAYIDAIQQSGLSNEDIQAICEHTGLSIEVTCDSILKIADALGGGLDPGGKRKWFYGHWENGLSLQEMLAIAEHYKDSPAT